MTFTYLMEIASSSEKSKDEKQWSIARRLVHGGLSIAAVYYWIPDPLVPGFPKWLILVIGLIIIVAIEIFRFKRNKKLPWLRPYEQKRPAAHTYAAIGLVIVVLIAPLQIGAAAIIAMAWADPVAGELRRYKRSEKMAVLFCGATYALLSFASLIFLGVDIIMAIALTAIMTVVGVASEAIDIRYLDDDLTMLVFPAIAGTMMILAFPLSSV